ncbi:MAG: chemotaxis protein CheX [Casimicrobiaceae bacterium]
MSELELDALTELVNLGISHSAKSLADMVRHEVILSVPRVALVSRDEAIEILADRESKYLVAVHQTFEGDITGRALLIFPEANSLELVRAVVGGGLSIEEIIEMEHEALAETGNVILNGCLATIANELNRSLNISLPEILHGESSLFFSLAPPPEPGDMVMFVYITFSVSDRNIEGYIAMLMDLPSLAALKILLDEFIKRTAGA